MIVPMKKISLLTLDCEKAVTMQKLRKLGLVHIDMVEGSGGRLAELREQTTKLEYSLFQLSERKDTAAGQEADLETCLTIADKIAGLTEEKKTCQTRAAAYRTELERLRDWGSMNPYELAALMQDGVRLVPYEMPRREYDALDEAIPTLVLEKSRKTVRFVTVQTKVADIPAPAEHYRIRLPEKSTAEMERDIGMLEARVREMDANLNELSGYAESIQGAIAALQKEIEMETAVTGMGREELSERGDSSVAIAWIHGYIPAESLDTLKQTATENGWGLVSDDPTPADDAPTQLKNNRFVSLIYPLTDFLGTVPGYFEYDISGWFLGFILIFFGIIFGDGGYGLLICAAAGLLIGKSKLSGKPVPPTYLLIGLLGLATILWGMLTCTWFGMSPESLPGWLKALSVPVLSNVNADRIWHPFWTNGEVGLTTAQNTQIFCFTLALVQLTVAHVKGLIRNRHSLKLLADLGSILQLSGMYYVVLSMVVNGAVFPLGSPVGLAAIGLVGTGFLLSFVFASYEGSIGAAILDSLKNIVSVLLGVVNVFSDIVSYIRLWAVGLAGAAISTTVNELAGPLFGDLLFVAIAVVLLVFGHGLNMILNVLSVIVHGVRLNTLEFSSHLDMSWSGHKYKPFAE